MVERDLVVGSSADVACVPTKSLVALARAERILRRAKVTRGAIISHPTMSEGPNLLFAMIET